jgi:hypothetical protein
MVALWFACQGGTRGDPRTPGVLFAFDVTDLPSLHTSEARHAPTWGNIQNPTSFSYLQALEESADHRRPFIVVPDSPDARMSAQKGLFLAGAVPETSAVDGVDVFHVEGIEWPGATDDQPSPSDTPKSQVAGQFGVIRVEPALKSDMLSYLDRCRGLDMTALFPDTAGLVDFLFRDGGLSISFQRFVSETGL